MVISELNLDTIKNYVGLTTAEDDTLLELIKQAAVQFIRSYTGLTEEELDNYHDLTLACLCLVNEMYLNRNMIVDRTNLNPTVKYILSMHTRNYV